MIGSISSAEEFWKMHFLTTGLHLIDDMFFLFREHVFPCWDDPSNIVGGCVSVRVPNETAVLYWEQLAARVLCEDIECNGISCSPKNNFCVFKVWCGGVLTQDELQQLQLPRGYVGFPMFKSNRDNISNGQQQRTTSS